MKTRVLFHDNCFDGMCSAGLFRAFYLEKVEPSADVVLGGLAHGPTGGLTAERLDGDENAVVDFRYLADEKLTWWFDHHRSAFPTDADRAHFEADGSGHKYFDPTAPSCTGFIARSVARDFGFDTSRFAELLHWADIIDAARFPEPKTAVELVEPALRLMLWIEHSQHFEERERLIDLLFSGTLEDAANAEFIRPVVDELLEEHRSMIDAFRKRCRVEGPVVFCDLTDLTVSAVNKFIPYYLHPEASYAVVVSRSEKRSKVSVGYSPWHPAGDRAHDISALCERYGGGGHPVVGAVTRTAEDVDDVRQVGREMVTALGG